MFVTVLFYRSKYNSFPSVCLLCYNKFLIPCKPFLFYFVHNVALYSYQYLCLHVRTKGAIIKKQTIYSLCFLRGTCAINVKWIVKQQIFAFTLHLIWSWHPIKTNSEFRPSEWVSVRIDKHVCIADWIRIYVNANQVCC